MRQRKISAEIRPYVRLTQIDEIANTIRPDIIRLEDYGNRKDVQLAIATLQEEFKPTRESMQKVEDFRRNNPGRSLPFDLARIEALSFGLGVRNSAGPCFLPSPPFPSNTPCPPPGSAIPITGYYSGGGAYPIGGFGPGSFGPGVPPPATGPQGEQLVYGKGPSSERTGQCPNGYHWMYDSGGWCMSNSGSYGTGGPGGPSGGGGPGYTPYSPYYSTPGYPPTSYGYQGAGPYYSTGPYTPPNYYGPAPTTYTTNPYPGSVPGSGPTPTAPGQCPDGYHWMGDSGGWCMANGGTYTPGSGGGGGVVPPSGCGYGSYWSTYENRCIGGQTQGPVGDASPNDGCPYGSDRGGQGNCIPNSYGPTNSGSCGPGSYWTGTTCVTSDTWDVFGPSPNLTQSSCGPGYYWSGSACYPSYGGGGGGTPSSCSYPSGGCTGYNSYFDYGTCSCRSSSTTPGTPTGPSASCSNYPSGGCGYNSWFDWGSCSCRSSSSTSTGGTTSTTGSCSSGYHWMSDSGGWCMADGGRTTSSPAPTSTTTTTTSGTTGTTGTTSTTGSCSSGFHWMSDSGGWCM